VTFAQVGAGLITYSAGRPISFELCGSSKNDCRYVDALLRSDQVTLEAGDLADPRWVRYCWGDAPICNLYDKSGLPAGPFELEIGR
jgi:sialate O-acetylesterase